MKRKWIENLFCDPLTKTRNPENKWRRIFFASSAHVVVRQIACWRSAPRLSPKDKSFNSTGERKSKEVHRKTLPDLFFVNYRLAASRALRQNAWKSTVNYLACFTVRCANSQLTPRKWRTLNRKESSNYVAWLQMIDGELLRSIA